MTPDTEGRGTHGVWHRFYRALLTVLPRELRDRQGDAMIELFDRELRRGATGGALGEWRVGVAGVADLVGRGIYERLSGERRALTAANVARLRRTAVAFLVTTVVLTTLFLVKSAMTRGAAPLSGSALDVALLSIPYTAALTIPMSVFVAVLWAAAHRSTRSRGDDSPGSARGLRLAPVIGMAGVVALCCLVLNTELVPRANLRLQAMYAGRANIAPSDRSMTLRELREAEAKLVSAPGAVTGANSDGPTLTSYAVEIQKKFALAAACVVLALLAAGIARRAAHIGILGQAGVSLVVFAGYYVCLMAGEHLADRSAVSPALAMWGANIVAVLLAVFMLAHGHERRSVQTTV